MNKPILILAILGAFIVGTLTANPIVDAASPMVGLLTDSIFGLEPIKNEVRKNSLQNQLLLLDLPDFKTTIDSAGNVGHFNSIAIGADGLPVISYSDFTNFDLKVAHCGNIACTSATLSTVDSTGFVGLHTSIAIGDDGLPVISYFDDDPKGNLKVAHCDDVACTSATFSLVDTTGDAGLHTSIAIGDDGLPVISYFDVNNNDLKVAHCGDAACTSATLSTVDSTGQVGEYNSIAIGADGLPVISYIDGSPNDDLKVAHCDDVACSSATFSIVDLDAAVSVGLDTSIAIGADGLPVISYNDFTNKDLKVAHCDDVACTSATLSTVDDVGDTGRSSSIAIGDDGLPVISYTVPGPDDFRVAHCDDVACTSATFTTLDVGRIFFDTSIAIGDDGLPVMSYFDDTNDDLKVVHCNDLACSPP